MFKNPPAWLKSYYFNSALAVALMLLLAFNNAYLTIWPIFGTANQLLAALTLIAVSAWLMIRGRNFWFAILPPICCCSSCLSA